MKRYIKASENSTSISPSEYLRNNFDKYPKGMRTYDIDGKQITTNLLAFDIPYWSGNTNPRCKRYTNVDNLGGNMSSAFDAMVAEGYTEIKFVYQTTSIRGYRRVYVFAK